MSYTSTLIRTVNPMHAAKNLNQAHATRGAARGEYMRMEKRQRHKDAPYSPP